MTDTEVLDELSRQLSSLSGQDKISVAVYNHTDSPHKLLFKNTQQAEDQARRVRSELNQVALKAKRKDKYNSNRALSQNDNPWSVQKSKRPKKKRCPIMLAEWFLHVPYDFENIYRFKLCPKGRHVCVIARSGRTDVIARSGTRIESFLSRLPGGGIGQNPSMMHRYETVLDCIMIDNCNKSDPSLSSNDSGSKFIFMVLDLICYKSTSYEDEPVSRTLLVVCNNYAVLYTLYF